MIPQNNEINERASPTRNRSVTLSERALKALNNVEETLRPNLTQAHAALSNVTSTLGYADDENNAIQL